MTTQLGNDGGLEDPRIDSDMGGSLIDSMLSPPVIEAASSVTDIAVSNLISNDLLTQIPIFGTVFSALKGAVTIHDYFFLKKIAYFLQGCEKRDFNERTKFEKELAIDRKLRTKVGENLLLILDRVDHFEKAAILGKVFGGRLRGDIDEDTFFRLVTAINNASVSDLRTLDLSYKKITAYDPKVGNPFSSALDDATAQSLFSAGLVGADGYTETTYVRNALGTCLLTLMERE